MAVHPIDFAGTRFLGGRYSGPRPKGVADAGNSDRNQPDHARRALRSARMATAARRDLAHLSEQQSCDLVGDHGTVRHLFSASMERGSANALVEMGADGAGSDTGAAGNNA